MADSASLGRAQEQLEEIITLLDDTKKQHPDIEALQQLRQMCGKLQNTLRGEEDSEETSPPAASSGTPARAAMALPTLGSSSPTVRPLPPRGGRGGFTRPAPPPGRGRGGSPAPQPPVSRPPLRPATVAPRSTSPATSERPRPPIRSVPVPLSTPKPASVEEEPEEPEDNNVTEPDIPATEEEEDKPSAPERPQPRVPRPSVPAKSMNLGPNSPLTRGTTSPISPPGQLGVRHGVLMSESTSSPNLREHAQQKSMPKPPRAQTQYQSSSPLPSLPPKPNGPPSPEAPSSSPESPSNPAPSSDLTVFKVGMVWKRKVSKKSLSNWKLRYFRLRNATLGYYVSGSDPNALGRIDMTTTGIRRIRPDDIDVHIKDGKPWCMELSLANGTVYHIATDTHDEMQEWLRLLEESTKLPRDIVPLEGKMKKSKSKGFGGFTIRGSSRKDKSSGSFIARREAEDVFSSPKTGSSPGTPDAPVDQRQSIIKEIYATERDYLTDLKVITEFYILKLESFNIMRKSEKDAIFANVEDLVPIHVALFADLEAEYEKPDPHFAPIFLNYVTRFTPYSHYCSSQSNSANEIERFRENNHNFAGCCDDLQQDPQSRKLDLPSYLIKPMQRICKYPLLLRELLKATPPDHDEYQTIDRAATLMSRIVTEVNENKRTADNVMQLLELQESISDLDISLQSSTRRIVKEAEFKKLQYDPSKEAGKHTMWLFNDLIVVAKKKEKGKYAFRLSLPVDSVVVWDLDPNGVAENKNAFSVFHTDPSVNKKIVISASSQSEKLEWMELLNDCIAQTGFLQ